MFGVILRKITGISMYPTFKSGDKVLIATDKKTKSRITVNDIIVFKTPKGFGKGYSIKRVVMFNENEFYVLGDNFEKSLDSRTYGYINKKSVKGKVICKMDESQKAFPQYLRAAREVVRYE